jgi:hemerythrin-like domain-containing protein
MEFLVREIHTRGKKVDPGVFRAMLYYLDTFSERMHHPKEDKYLFEAMRARSREADALIADLEAEHARGGDALRVLAQGLVRYEEGGAAEFPAFEHAIEEFARNYREHIRKEEELLLPLALRVLTAADWSRLAIVFEKNRDPLALGRDTRDFDRFFARIAEIAPSPIGFGRGTPSQ